MKLSIIFYLHDHSDNLKNSLESLLNQSSKDFNLIFVDDCCTNDVFEIFDEYFPKFKNAKIIKFSENLGMSYCYNAVLKFFKTDYVYFYEPKIMFYNDLVKTFYKMVNLKSEGYDLISFDKKTISFLSRSSKINYDIDFSNKKTNHSFIINTKLSIKSKIFRTNLLLDNNIKFQEFKHHHSVFLYNVLRKSKNALIINEQLFDGFEQNHRSFDYNLYDILESAEILYSKLNYDNFNFDEKETYEVWIYILVLYEFLKKMFISYWDKTKILNSAIENANNLINKLAPHYKKNNKLIYLIDKNIYKYIANFVPSIAYIKKNLF